MNAPAAALFRCIWIALAAGALCACSDADRGGGQMSSSGGSTVGPARVAGAAGNADTLSAELVADGVPATYRASFDAEQTIRIAETHAAGAAGEYEFKGARLLGYSGASLQGGGQVQLRFNLQGALLAARGETGPLAPMEISAIRTRAQLLRSHALAQRAARSGAATLITSGRAAR